MGLVNTKDDVEKHIQKLSKSWALQRDKSQKKKDEYMLLKAVVKAFKGKVSSGLRF